MSTAITRRSVVLARKVAPDASPIEKARHYYLAAREIRYDPDLDFPDPEVYRASSVLNAGAGYCVGKAALFAGCLVPAAFRRASRSAT